MKKKIIVTVIVSVLICAVAVGFAYSDDILVFFTHRSIAEAYNDYPVKSVQKGKYSLKSIKTVSEDNVTNFSFVVKDEEEVVFECPHSWRAWDLKYIGFVDETEVLVVSADVGCTSFRSANGSWVEIENPYIPPLKSIDKDKAVFVADNYEDYFTE